MPTKPKQPGKAVKKQTTNAGLKKYAEPRNKTGKGGFTGADDPRRNNAGQRKREVIATASQARDLYVKVLHEPINTPVDKEMSNLELIVRQHVKSAKMGDPDERELMFNRIWGKSMQPMEVSGPNGEPLAPTAIQIIPYVKPDSDPA